MLRLVFHTEFKVVLTGSMEPDLHVGSLLVIMPAEYDEIEIGDDITFVRDEELNLVTHRVIAKDDDKMTITTKGIANNTPDKPTIYENVVGKVRFSIPLIGYIGVWLSTPSGVIAVITVVAVIILGILLLRLFRKPAAKDGKESEQTETQEADADPENK